MRKVGSCYTDDLFDLERMGTMPTNKKESIIFGLMMCFGMVAVMSTYNLLISGNIQHLTLQNIVIEVVLGFIIALFLDFFIVGPFAKKITLKLPFAHSSKLLFVLCMSTLMILGMVFFMSMFGFLMSYFGQGLEGRSMISAYGTIFIRNVVLALPLQLLVMGPAVRFIFSKYFQKRGVELSS